LDVEQISSDNPINAPVGGVGLVLFAPVLPPTVETKALVLRYGKFPSPPDATGLLVQGTPPVGPFSWHNVNSGVLTDITTFGAPMVDPGPIMQILNVPGLTAVSGVRIEPASGIGPDVHIIIERPGIYQVTLLGKNAIVAATGFVATDVDYGISLTTPATDPPVAPTLDLAANSSVFSTLIPAGVAGSGAIAYAQANTRMDLWIKAKRDGVVAPATYVTADVAQNLIMSFVKIADLPTS